MAIRKKIRTLTMLTTTGETSLVNVTTTYLNSLRSLIVHYDVHRCPMYFEGTMYLTPLPATNCLYLGVNELATTLAHQSNVKRGRSRSNQLLKRYSGSTYDAITGAVYFDNIAQRSRYTRVVSIRPLAPYHTPNVVADTRNAVTDWTIDQFPNQYRPYFLYDHRGCFVGCEHPDETIRDAWLVACRLRWG